ncbi:hypothetical protein BGZ60DRAFT_515846 [Tricladium varicosporioides]|nr:hypothetical protein BGZ60DRAFT_515846 [Hymenoscyphus varicosporioides]
MSLNVTGISIDSNNFTTHFLGQSKILLSDVIRFVGTGWVPYPTIDIIYRIQIWVIPLFILIASFEFAPLRFLNTVFIATHIFASPITSIYNLLSKLAIQQEIWNLSQHNSLDKSVNKSLAVLVTAYQDWSILLTQISPKSQDDIETASSSISSQTPRDTLTALQTLLLDKSDPNIQEHRINECQIVARELSDARKAGIGKMMIGTVNYFVALGMALTHVTKGDFNNRTGHSLAFGLLWTGLLVIVWLSAIEGGFITRYSVRMILSRLQRSLDRLEEAETLRKIPGLGWTQMRSSELQRGQEREEEGLNISENTPLKNPSIFTFYSISSKNAKNAYNSLEGMGMNYCLTPSPLSSTPLKLTLVILSVLPVAFSTTAAFVISFTSPTEGVGCRNILQVSFFAVWVASSVFSVAIRRLVKGAWGLWIERVKDGVVGSLLLGFFMMGFVGFVKRMPVKIAWIQHSLMCQKGWFNRPECWAATFSLGSLGAYILPDTLVRDAIIKLGGRIWPTITYSLLGSHIMFVMGVWWWWREGAGVYRMNEEEREKWWNEGLIVVRRKSLASVAGAKKECKASTPPQFNNQDSTNKYKRARHVRYMVCPVLLVNR